MIAESTKGNKKKHFKEAATCLFTVKTDYHEKRCNKKDMYEIYPSTFIVSAIIEFVGVIEKDDNTS